MRNSYSKCGYVFFFFACSLATYTWSLVLTSTKSTSTYTWKALKSKKLSHNTNFYSPLQFFFLSHIWWFSLRLAPALCSGIFRAKGCKVWGTLWVLGIESRLVTYEASTLLFYISNLLILISLNAHKLATLLELSHILQLLRICKILILCTTAYNKALK